VISVIDTMHDMELRHLEHFVAVAEEASFTRAAARVRLVQSALSVSIRTLERDLGTVLFDRTTHRVELTDTGCALLTEARRTLAAAEVARDAVAAVEGGLRGSLRLGIMHSLTLIDLAGLITRYQALAPEVQLIPTVAGGGSLELARMVRDGRLDLAFAALGEVHPAELKVHRLAAEDLLLACPPGHRLGRRRQPLDLADLDGERFIDVPQGWGVRTVVDRAFRELGLSREIVVEVADLPLTSELVRAGLGFAFMAPSMVSGVPRPVLRRVRSAPTFAVSLLTPEPIRALSAASRKMADLVLASYPAPS
jgi:DNA-binding transcriptional LysR family regulator